MHDHNETWGQTHLEDQNQESRAQEERDETADEPAEPEDATVKAHDLHGLFQPGFLLIRNPFDDHRHRVDPSQGHEEGQ